MTVELPIKPPRTDKIYPHLEFFYKILEEEILKETNEEFYFNLEEIKWGSPHFLVPFSCMLHYLRKQEIAYKISDLERIKNHSVKEYLKTIYFPDGFRSTSEVTWEDVFSDTERWNDEFSDSESWSSELLNSVMGTNYTPIINFPAGTGFVEVREKFIGAIDDLIMSHIGLSENFHETAVRYLVHESVVNILEHANVSSGWVQAQYYPSKEYLDICIADNGLSILGSYKKANRNQITEDKHAIEKALAGESTKGKERGFGIRTSKNMLTSDKGLGGVYTLISGDSLYYRTPDEKDFLQFNSRWDGTIVCLRIPKATDSFDFYRFVE